MISKQLILALILLLGGAVTVFAVFQNKEQPTQDTAVQTAQEEVARPAAVPLTADVGTEGVALAQKQQARELHDVQSAQQAAQLLGEQEQAQQLALDKAQQEEQARQDRKNANQPSQTVATPSVQVRPEAEQARLEQQKQEEQAKAEQAEKERQAKEKQAQEARAKEAKAKEQVQTQKNTAKSSGGHKVVAGDNLTRLANHYGVSVAELAAANNMGRDDTLQLGRTIKIPSAGQAKHAPAKKDDKVGNKKETKNDTQKSSASYSVQVALSADKAKVDELVQKYRAAGYKVSTSQTDRGTRVLIGSAKSYDDANAIRKKLANDSRVDAKDAWVKKMEP